MHKLLKTNIMNTKNKRFSRPKSEINTSRLACFNEIQLALNANPKVSTSEIASRHNVSQHAVTMLRKIGFIEKYDIGKQRWVGNAPSMDLVKVINNELRNYQAFKKLKNKCTNDGISKPFIIGAIINGDGAMEFDFDAPDVGKRETLLERQMRKSSKVIELDENAMKAWEQKMKEQKAEKTDIPFVAPVDSSMVSEFIDHERNDRFIHLRNWEKLIVFGMVALIVSVIVSVFLITFKILN